MAKADDFLDAPIPQGGSFFDDVRNVIAPLRGRITSTTGGRHNVGSAHYSGGALDVGMARETPEQQEAIKAALVQAGYRVRDERSRPAGQAVWTGPHLHVTRGGGAPAASPRPAMSAADAFLDGPGSGGGGSADAFLDEQAAPDLVTGFRTLNAARAPGPAAALTSPPAAPVPASQIPADGDYRSVFAPDDQSSFGKIGLRALVGRVPEIAANLVELPGNVAGAIGDTSPTGSRTMTVFRELFGRGADAIRDFGYEREMQQAGYGVPSVTGGQVLDAINPAADVPLLDRASRVGRFIPETLLASSPDMAAAVGALPAYIAARTNEVAENRAANDQRANPSVADLAIAAPAATAESVLERLTTMRLLPGGGAVPTPGLAGAAGRVAKETGLQGTTGALEEAIPYVAETMGTQTPTTGRGLAEALATGLVAEGGLGGAVQTGSEAAAAAGRPRVADLPADPATLADLLAQAQAPAVAAEVPASPRQDVAPAAPPPPQQVERQEAPAPAQPRPDMTAATRAIDGLQLPLSRCRSRSIAGGMRLG